MSTDMQIDSRAQRTRAASSASPTIGGWQLVRLLGSGRFAEAYQARPAGESTTSADYVIKVLKSQYRHDPLAVSFLQRESFVAREVAHPHLMTVLSDHIDAPPYFLVTPHLTGATLDTAIRYATRLTIPHALWLSRQTAEALHALHREGWIHGDVKPQNVLVAPNGHVTLLDLGFARRVNRDAGEREFLATTLSYAPPEAFNENVPLTGHSDIYSLGVMLYESLTGTLPFSGDEPHDLAAAHLAQAPPDARRLVPELSRRIGRLLRRMLAKEPLRRPNAEELVPWLCELEIETFAERAAA